MKKQLQKKNQHDIAAGYRIGHRIAKALQGSRIEREHGFICTLLIDQENISVFLIARESNKDIVLLVRTNQHQNTKKNLCAGADRVILFYKIGADRIANVNQFVNQIQGGSSAIQVQDHLFDDVKVFKGSTFKSTICTEAPVWQNYFVVIIAIIPDNSDNIRFNQGSDDHISAGDSLFVFRAVKRIEYLQKRNTKITALCWNGSSIIHSRNI
jgi:voltage-gated potassium channel